MRNVGTYTAYTYGLVLRKCAPKTMERRATLWWAKNNCFQFPYDILCLARAFIYSRAILARINHHQQHHLGGLYRVLFAHSCSYTTFFYQLSDDWLLGDFQLFIVVNGKQSSTLFEIYLLITESDGVLPRLCCVCARRSLDALIWDFLFHCCLSSADREILCLKNILSFVWYWWWRDGNFCSFFFRQLDFSNSWNSLAKLYIRT